MLYCSVTLCSGLIIERWMNRVTIGFNLASLGSLGFGIPGLGSAGLVGWDPVLLVTVPLEQNGGR